MRRAVAAAAAIPGSGVRRLGDQDARGLLNPISEAEFAGLMAPFGATGPVVVAVSGGADSMALAWLLRGWGDPLAVIVDHGLRPGSAAEGAVTAGRLHAFGVPTRVVTLALRPGPDLGARARRARYAALLSVCRETGRPDLLVAHHAADQAETVAMRRAAASGEAGLAGMAAVAWRDEARIVRPLLGIAPGRLRATLRAAGVDWAEDPSNAGSARGLLRAGGVPPDTGSDVAGRERAEAEQELSGELAAAVELFPLGYARVAGPLSAGAWSVLLWCVSGRTYPPSPRAVRRLAQDGAGTLHGVMARGGWVAREPSALPPPVPAEDGAVWDGRFVVRSGLPCGATLGALGADAERRRPGPPSFVLRGLPALRRRGELLIDPDMTYHDGATCRNVGVAFRPARLIAPAPFWARGMHMGPMLPMLAVRTRPLGIE